MITSFGLTSEENGTNRDSGFSAWACTQCRGREIARALHDRGFVVDPQQHAADFGLVGDVGRFDLERDGAAGRRCLQCGEWELPAREETCAAALNRDQVRLRKDLQQVASLQSTDGRAYAQVGPQNEQVQQVGEIDVGAVDLSVLKLKLAKARLLELLGGDPADCLGIRGEVVEPEFRESHAIHARELHFEKNLTRIARRRGLQQVDDVFITRRSKPFEPLHIGCIAHAPGKDDGVAAGGSIDSASRDRRPQFGAELVPFRGIGPDVNVPLHR